MLSDLRSLVGRARLLTKQAEAATALAFDGNAADGTGGEAIAVGGADDVEADDVSLCGGAQRNDEAQRMAQPTAQRVHGGLSAAYRAARHVSKVDDYLNTNIVERQSKAARTGIHFHVGQVLGLA